MTATQTARRAHVEPAGAPAGRTWCARAYCGPAHGRRWELRAAAAPPSVVELTGGGQRVRYRLVHHPRTRQPARDHLGNFLYMPVLYGFGT